MGNILTAGMGKVLDIHTTLALKAASYVFLIRESIPYLLLRYGRLKIHLSPLSSFWGVAHTSALLVVGELSLHKQHVEDKFRGN